MQIYIVQSASIYHAGNKHFRILRVDFAHVVPAEVREYVLKRITHWNSRHEFKVYRLYNRILVLYGFGSLLVIESRYGDERKTNDLWPDAEFLTSTFWYDNKERLAAEIKATNQRMERADVGNQ